MPQVPEKGYGQRSLDPVIADTVHLLKGSD